MRTKKEEVKTGRGGALGSVNNKYLKLQRWYVVFVVIVFFLQLMGMWNGTIELINDVLEYFGINRAFGGVMNTIMFAGALIYMFSLDMVEGIDTNS